MKKKNKIIKKLKILEVTSFSAGFCGIWFRVGKEAELLAEKGHEVYVFSSNIKRGSGKIETASEHDTIEQGKVKIKRFKTFGSLGQNSFFWNYKKEALNLKPDIILCHAYRQYYSTLALKISKKLEIPCILVTHAPFLEKKLRNWKLNLAVWLYDNFIGKRIINDYSKIFTITKWEIPYLLKLGAEREKIIYVPNGIPEEFFKIKILKRRSTNKVTKILFLGRIAPIKDIETLVRAFFLSLKKNRNMELNFVGPIEEDYGEKIKKIIKNLNLEKKVKFLGPVFDLKKKIEIIDSCDIFVLPSRREGMPQSLIEAMSREKIVISSTTQAGKELVADSWNGYAFEIGNIQELSEKILNALKNNEKNKKIRKNARKSVEQFSWNKLINKINNIIQKEITQKTTK